MKKYALMIGVEDYADDPGLHSAKYVRNDVSKVGEMLEQHCGFEVLILAGADSESVPTSLAVLKALENAGKYLEADDLFVFMFAGHGVEMPDYNGSVRSYLLASNALPRHYQGMLELGQLRLEMDKINCRHRVLLLDCCRNDPESTRRGGGGENLLGKKLRRELDEVGKGASDIGRTTVTMRACKAGQFALGWDEKQHGVFSYYLIEGLRKEARANDKLEVMDLCEFVQRSVWRWSSDHNEKQFPEFDQFPVAGRIVLADLESSETNESMRPIPNRIDECFGHLKIMRWENSWVKRSIDLLEVSKRDEAVSIHNCDATHDHIKIVFDRLLEGDFGVTLAVSGDVRDLQLQRADGADVNFYVNPGAAGVSFVETARFNVLRRGNRIEFSEVTGKILSYSEFPGGTDTKMPVLVSIAVPAGGRVCIADWRVTDLSDDSLQQAFERLREQNTRELEAAFRALSGPEK